ncbi:hypothetical protein FS764_20400 [Agrobacterium vitis]|nr:hypothetical protein [Agrobacterium vitis]
MLILTSAHWQLWFKVACYRPMVNARPLMPQPMTRVLITMGPAMGRQSQVARRKNGCCAAFIGHAGAASDAIGLVKALLGLKLGVYFGMPDFQQINPMIDFGRSPCEIDSRCSEWPRQADFPQRNQIPQRKGRGRIPLSFAQRRRWFLDHMVPGSADYNVAITISLKARMDFAILQQSVDAMVMRHNVLRTTIGRAEVEARQEIAERGSLPMSLIDLRHLTEGQDAALQADIAHSTRVPFDLEKGPIFRLTAYRLADEQQVILLLAHHIAIEGWSLGPNARIVDLRRRLSQHAEKELVIDPCFFSRLKQEELEMEDWRSRSPTEQDAALEAYLEADRQRGIETEKPGAMRYFLAEIDNETSLCVMSFSFLCLDGWSYNLLTNELLERLDALSNGRHFDPPAAMAFRRFVEHVNRQDLDSARRY